MYLINNRVMPSIPFSKFVLSFLEFRFLLILPKYVLNPVSITIALALPLTTLAPIKHILFIPKISVVSFVSNVFSTKTLSPVKTD